MTASMRALLGCRPCILRYSSNSNPAHQQAYAHVLHCFQNSPQALATSRHMHKCCNAVNTARKHWQQLSVIKHMHKCCNALKQPTSTSDAEQHSSNLHSSLYRGCTPVFALNNHPQRYNILYHTLQSASTAVFAHDIHPRHFSKSYSPVRKRCTAVFVLYNDPQHHSNVTAR